MAKINSYTFGSIMVDDATYKHDIYILPSGKVEQREYGHTFTREQVEHVLKENPEVVITGKGASGMAKLSSDARALLKKNGVEIIEANTPDATDKFNKLSQTKKVAAIIHITC
jgi:hypothetical protein